MNIKRKNIFCHDFFYIKKKEKRKKKFYTYFMLSFGFSLVDFTLI